MGCCVSSATADKKDDPVSGKNTAPPPSVVEEETVVKEVLSETTLITSSNDDNSAMETTKTKIPEDEEKKPGAADVAPDPVLTDTGSVKPEKGSEVSEVCSLSESLLSIVNGYDGEEAKQRKSQPQGVRQRSPAKSRNRVMVNYPTQRTDMSPGKRNTEGGGGAGSVRLVPTERSERRRSRSPAMNRPVVAGPPTRNHYSTDNCGAVRTKGQSPGRVRPDPNKNGSYRDCHHQWPSCGAAGGSYNSTPNDSFENPLVSLECFIFL